MGPLSSTIVVTTPPLPVKIPYGPASVWAQKTTVPESFIIEGVVKLCKGAGAVIDRANGRTRHA